MKLSISNFAKIDKADITIDGITVIAGENNTGKSTIGKIIFFIFNSLCNIEEKVYKQRISNIKSLNRKIMQNHIKGSQAYSEFMNYYSFVNKYCREILKDGLEKSKNDIDNELNIELKNYIDKENETFFDDYDLMINEIVDNIVEVNNLSNDILTKEIITRYFNSVFNRQVNSLSVKDDEDAEVIL